jgi:FMN phosphatase YigB (HAD superfamily)
MSTIERFLRESCSLQLKVLPFVPDVLDKLRGTEINNVKLRLGVISNTGEETLARMRSVMAEARFFDPALLLFSSVEGIDKRRKQFFERAVQRSGTRPEQCIYVGEDEVERRIAESAKLRTSYHPLHVFHVIGLVAQGASNPDLRDSRCPSQGR